jgi:signal recognition particle subunit SRP54
MFDTLTAGFKTAISKIRFSDDDKALKKAMDELKKALLQADVHYKVTKDLLHAVEIDTKQNGIGKENFLKALETHLNEILTTVGNQGFVYSSNAPTVVLMAGLQGSGKTTTTAKLGFYLKQRNKKVLLAACDLQRAAAVEQLKQLGLGIEVDVYAEDGNGDAVKVAMNALEKAKRELYDVLIIDSAGRLAIDEALMGELKKVKEAILPFETLYVADSMAGQDAVKTAQSFHEQIGISGVIFSKFDGDSKGGVALGVAKLVGVPLRFIGTGEKPADLEVFIPNRITSRLIGLGDVESLAEKVSTVIDEKKAKELTQKIKKGQFSFNDFLGQIEEMKKLGSIKNLVGMMPGMGHLAAQIKDIDLDNGAEIKRTKAIISSMTKKERENPDLLNNSRKRRIASGAGVEQMEVNRFLKQFDQAAKMAKKFSSKNGMKDLMAMMGQQQKAGFSK